MFPLFQIAINTGAWAIFNALEIASLDIRHKTIFSNIEYISIVSIPVLWVLFSLDYSGLNPGKDSHFPRITLLAIIPAITLILVWTSQWHGLMRKAITLDISGPFSRIAKTYGPWFWIHTAYSYSLAAFGSLVIGHTVFHPSKIYRSQALILMTGTLIPWTANAAYLLFQGNAFAGMDITPIGFAISALLLEIGIVKTGLFSIMGIARDYVLDEIDDIVIITDAANRILDLNLPAQNLLGTSNASVIGRNIAEILRPMEGLFSTERAAFNRYFEDFPKSAISIPGEVPFLVQGESRFYDIKISPLSSGAKAPPRGKLITAKDVSRHRTTYQTLEQLQRELKEQAIRDPLTGLYNRRGLAESLLSNLDKYKKGSSYVSVVMTDINGFKRINDHYGHQTGDQVLEQIAVILQELSRPSGIAARYGGDEFVLIIPESQATEEQLFTCIKDAIEEWNKDNPLIEMPITMAIGIARCHDSEEPVEACLHKADSLMYQNKQDGRH